MPKTNPFSKKNTNIDQLLSDLNSPNSTNQSRSEVWGTLYTLNPNDFENQDIEKVVRVLTLEKSSRWNVDATIYWYLDKLIQRNYEDFDDLLNWVLIQRGGNYFLNLDFSLSENFVRRLIALGFEIKNEDRTEALKTSGWHSRFWEFNSDQDRDHDRIPKLFYQRLVISKLTDDELLLEALLLRGFLAYRDASGVWLGSGSHPDDLIVLKWVHGLSLRLERGHTERMASIQFKTSNRNRQLSSVAGILSIPQNTSWMGERAYPYQLKVRTWSQYRATAWGTKLSVCPSTFLRDRWLGYDALDAGIALLVKAWPLARVSTDCHSCDGHGQHPARVCLNTDWDREWAKAVFKILAVPTPHSVWFENGDGMIKPINNDYDDESVFGLLDDIQRFARRLLNVTVIEKIGHARTATLSKFVLEPAIEDFSSEAAKQLSRYSF
jgi:hypothetical protein